MPRGGKRMPSLQDVAETMEGDELDAILSSALDRPRSRRCGAPQAFENSEDGLEEFQVASRSYFAQVRDINRRGEMRLIPDVESWATYLGITRKTILNYEKRGEDWQNAIAFYKGIITACKKQLALAGKMPPVLAIFDLTNNSDYVNASEFRLSAEAAPETKQITAEEWEKVIDAEPEAPKLSDFKLSDDLN